MGRWIAWSTCRSLHWALEAAVLQAIAGAFSWEKSCRAGVVQLAIQLLYCSAHYFRASPCSGTTLEGELMKLRAALLLPGWAGK